MALLRRPPCFLGALALAAWGASALQGGGEDSTTGNRYTAEWESLDERPLPKWYDEAKFGIFIHWGVFSVPSRNSESEWYWWGLNGQEAPGVAEEYPPRMEWHNNTIRWHKEEFGEDFKYQDFAAHFKAKLFDPDEWAEMFKNAGAKYVVLTSKHHEGFTMWPSKYSSNWNSVDIGPHRDLVGDLTNAVRSKGMTMGLYHSMYEWFHPLYLEDKKNNFTTRHFPKAKTIPELREIVEKYKPDVIFSDGEWDASEAYWGSEEFLAWLYNDSPVKDTVVVNDRWGTSTRLKHGDYFSGGDRQAAGANLLNHKWESCITVDILSWGFNRVTPLSGFLSATDILQQLSSTVAYGGNLLLNVGPTADGTITPIYQERLAQVGDFLKVNGEAIYGSRPCKVQNETAIEGAYYTVNHERQLLYLTVIQKSGYWPRPGTILDLKAVKTAARVELLTASAPLAVECTDTAAFVQCTMPSIYDAGIQSKAVSPHGFVLRLHDALVVDLPVGVDLAPFMT